MVFLKRLLKGNSKEAEGTLSKEAVKTEAGEVSGSEEHEIVEKEILPEKMICPDCGGITLVGLDFCDKCGGELGNYENY
ncbi:hypothetical protein [Anaerocolumna xylanovorans]|uniref:Double zinc ribbon n=1 Tax=Anaerocolumna xylanovorans DSM 12503 TaxID=1121345 RepID=A0A1M7YHL6_9FIRM|nr:hypothetical protein [Anaerocolumna xylanovorans]SHO52144.1 hypothetical protein SAMN02745217_03533 [Anaerocolumna xylanovorans DSM 12503]